MEIETLALLFAAMAAIATQKHPKRQGTIKNQILETGPTYPSHLPHLQMAA